MILKALGLLLGERFSQRLIADGATRCEVTGLFRLSQNLCQQLGEAFALEGDELLIRRVFKSDGKSSVHLQGRLSSLEELRRLAPHLCLILSQDESLGLRDPNLQLDWLDRFAGHQGEREIFLQAYLEARRLEKEWAAHREKAQALFDQRDFLSQQKNELDALELRSGECAEIEAQHLELANAEEIRGSTTRLVETLQGAASGVDRDIDNLESLMGSNAEWSTLLREVRELTGGIEEWCRAAQRKVDKVSSDPRQLAKFDERLRLLKTAFKKFRRDESSLIEYAGEISRKLESIESLETGQDHGAAIATAWKNCLSLSKALHKKRLKAALRLEQEVNTILNKLDLAGDRFHVHAEERKELEENGSTSLRFQLRPTPTLPFQDLHESASGGETSRALLALCSCLSKVLDCSSIILDEIDTSMGARLGKPVAEAILKFSGERQVICVTHLAPVAASGGRHFLVEKNEHGSQAREIKGAERMAELAQMIAGDKKSSTALKQAQHMLAQFH